ncbi:hypothetical protein HMN09_01354900 [Mycena chlorophos]|uniref:Dienelactone hydrolase domain-containing protein n=1 Tax=Mycena chlorophos TaxID=658473 RepID=A0A8H6VP96_MYCCL|nr:hypothetical protein HMN09_01354900 [Mycena chlorophos]
MSVNVCEHCIKGVRHEGTPEGELTTVGGIETYVATPTGAYAKDKAILYLTDVFGPRFLNHQLLADDFARNGFKVYVPDICLGDPVPTDSFDPGVTYDLPAWLARHGGDVTRPVIDKVLEALKAEGVTSLAATGYCLGGRYVFDLAFDNAIQVGATAHPSYLSVPKDLEKYVATSKAPLLLLTCPVDWQFPIEAQATADKVFANFEPGYKRVFYEGCKHGFAVRGDLSDPLVKAGKEGAFLETTKFFKQYL